MAADHAIDSCGFVRRKFMRSRSNPILDAKDQNYAVY